MGTLYKNYSGHVHGASVYIMDMYCGDPPHFHTNGISDEAREFAHARNLYNYTLREPLINPDVRPRGMI